MKPKITNIHPDLFRSQLSQIINLAHPLCRLAAKCKIHKRYEFGSKASFVTTSKDN